MMMAGGIGGIAGGAAGTGSGSGTSGNNADAWSKTAGYGQPAFGMFGSTSTDPGTAANGGWTTTTKKNGWFG